MTITFVERASCPLSRESPAPAQRAGRKPTLQGARRPRYKNSSSLYFAILTITRSDQFPENDVRNKQLAQRGGVIVSLTKDGRGNISVDAEVPMTQLPCQMLRELLRRSFSPGQCAARSTARRISPLTYRAIRSGAIRRVASFSCSVVSLSRPELNWLSSSLTKSNE